MIQFRQFVLVLLLAILGNFADAAEIRSATLVVEGMTCAACPLTVKQLLKDVPGVTEVTVDGKSRLARIKYDPQRTRPEQLAKKVTDIGYPTAVLK